MCDGTAYIDSEGYPRTASGSLHICIGGNAGGAGDGSNVPAWAVMVPGLDSQAFIDFMDGTGPDAKLPDLPATISAPGIGGIVADISLKTGIPEWAIIAAAALTAVYALHELVGD